MSESSRTDWYAYLYRKLKESTGNAGAACIRADLCSQIIAMPDDILYEMCIDIGSVPNYWMEKPAAAVRCDDCRALFGKCAGDTGDVNEEQCRQRFWEAAERFTQAS